MRQLTGALAGVFVLACMANTAMAAPSDVATEGETTRNWRWLGDLRAGYFASEREDRDGSRTDKDEGRLRLRFGVEGKFSDRWSGRIRAAGRYSTEDNPGEVKFFTSIPAPEGLRFGDTTIDELFFRYQHSPTQDIKLGRFQSNFKLDGVAKKSLDRNTSHETQITWTDGIGFAFLAKSGWRNHVLAQYNYSDGATEVRRKPLDFSDNKTRVSFFFATENKNAVGPLVQRGVDLSYLPKALCVDGVVTCQTRESYWALVFRGALRWPLSQGGMYFLLGGSAGYAPNTQLKTVANTGTTGDTDGSAFQVSFNLVDFVPKHSLGLVLGQVGAGWLISPDFRNNNTLIEGRYRFNLAKQHKIEFRLRRREDLERLVGANQKRVDDDLYLRYTFKL